MARDAAGLQTTSTPVSITVNAAANQPPTVSLTSPADASSFLAPASIAVGATAADTDGTIARVDFYAGASLIGSDATSPYAVTWSSVAAGTYAITAVARDNAGASTTSLIRTITVTNNQAPNVSLTSPTAGATFSAPATITIAASATDTDGSIARVEFYSGGVLIGTDTTAPYSFSWSNVVVGQYSITARAVDNQGAMTMSTGVTVTVSDPNLPGNAVWTPSPDHDTSVDHYVVEFFPAGADTTTANPVASQNVGKPVVVNGECHADVNQTVSMLPPGSYVATVTAVAADGATARSAPSAAFTR